MSATFDPSGHGGSKESQRCPDCESIFNKFYTGDPNGVISDSAHGITTSDCLKADYCWFHSGQKKCVPKHCASVGHYCHVYVWVLPEGQDQLTKLTLAILDYAQNGPPVGLNKTIVFWVDEYGIPTEQKLAVGSVTATVGIDEQPASLLNTSNAEEGRLVQSISARLKAVNDRMAELKPEIEKANAAEANKLAANQGQQQPSGTPKTPGGGARARKNDPNFEEYRNLLTEKQTLDDKLVYLREQLRTPGLKQRYMSLGPSISPGSALLPFNLIQGATVPQAPVPGPQFSE
jgi:hypothetical protein